jgi:hypothetical protein
MEFGAGMILIREGLGALDVPNKLSTRALQLAVATGLKPCQYISSLKNTHVCGKKLCCAGNIVFFTFYSHRQERGKK